MPANALTAVSSLLRRVALLLCGVLVLLAFPSTAAAHGGPPYLVVPEQALGPYVVTAWADPDVGTGVFIIEATVGGAPVPAGTTVALLVQPADGQAPAAHYTAGRQQRLFGGEQFVANVAFTSEGHWTTRLLLDGPAGHGETTFTVQATPPGLDWVISLLCLVPFVALGVLWFIGLRRARRTVFQPDEGRG